MNWITVLVSLIRIFEEITHTWKEANDEKKKLRIMAKNEALEALSNRDTAGLTRAFSKLNGMRH